jgi:hypothetical protein
MSSGYGAGGVSQDDSINSYYQSMDINITNKNNHSHNNTYGNSHFSSSLPNLTHGFQSSYNSSSQTSMTPATKYAASAQQQSNYPVPHNNIINNNNYNGSQTASKYVHPRTSSLTKVISNAYDSDQSNGNNHNNAYTDNKSNGYNNADKSNGNNDDERQQTTVSQQNHRTYTSRFDATNIKAKQDVVSSVCPPSLQSRKSPIPPNITTATTNKNNNNTNHNHTNPRDGYTNVTPVSPDAVLSSHTSSHAATHSAPTHTPTTAPHTNSPKKSYTATSHSDSDSDKRLEAGHYVNDNGTMHEPVPMLQLQSPFQSPKWIPSPVMDFSGDMTPPLSSIFKPSHEDERGRKNNNNNSAGAETGVKREQ